MATPHGDAVLCVAGKGVDGRGNDRHCAARPGKARMFVAVCISTDTSRWKHHQARLGVARHGKARPGNARQGKLNERNS